ncbi:MAG: hypothetical protein JWN76_3107 [Chitinophagaceae bacterium]|nr:hypothetical protein [Chitinophagaceae bacterium]
MKHLWLAIAVCALSLSAKSQYSTVVLEQKPITVLAKPNTYIQQWDENQPGYQFLSSQQKELFYWTNYSRSNPRAFWDSVVAPILSLFPNINNTEYSRSLKQDLYKSASLLPLRLNDTLAKTSQEHASDIGLNEGTFSHSSTDGTTFQDRFHLAGLKNYGGENISLGNGNMLLALVLLYLDHDLPDLGHRKTLMNPDYTDIGLGICKYGNTNSVFFVQDFSSPQYKLYGRSTWNTTVK